MNIGEQRRVRGVQLCQTLMEMKDRVAGRDAARWLEWRPREHESSRRGWRGQSRAGVVEKEREDEDEEGRYNLGARGRTLA